MIIDNSLGNLSNESEDKCSKIIERTTFELNSDWLKESIFPSIIQILSEKKNVFSREIIDIENIEYVWERFLFWLMQLYCHNNYLTL